MTVKKAFKNWMVGIGIATSGQIKLTRAPSGRNVTNNLWWLKSEGGFTTHLATGEPTTTYQIGIYYRHTDPQAVDQSLETLADTINTVGCLNLSSDGYKVVAPPITSSPQTDQDIDAEDRTVGYLQTNLVIKQEL